MALAGTELRRALDTGVWSAWRDGEPCKASELKCGPVSVDGTLGYKLLRITRACGWRYIDLHEQASMHVHEIEMNVDGFVLQPGQHYLGHIRESFECSARLEPWGWFYPVIDGRSTPARATGLCVHATAGRGDFAWGGPCAQFTLEMSSREPVLIRPGQRLAQIYFEPVESSSEPERYSGAYTEQNGPRAAELGKARFQG